MLHWLTQPGKEQRASAYIEKSQQIGDFTVIKFKGISEEFYYPCDASWIDLCQTVDEVFNNANWHCFLTKETPIDGDDVVVDCGAAEGLFFFMAASMAAKVYAIEPIPSWHAGLTQTFSQYETVEILKVGVGSRDARMRMTNEEIYSRVSADGELEIPVRTLDSLFANEEIPVSFIKADIEGYEFPMLIGAERTIRKNRPKLSLTVYHDANHFLEIQEYLRDIHKDYRFRIRGMAENGNPVLLQAY